MISWKNPIHKVVLITIGGLIPVFSVIYYLTPSLEEELMEGHWCVQSIEINGELFVPNTIYESPRIVWGGCEEQIVFKKSGKLELPSFQAPTTHALWTIRDGLLEISEADQFENLYNQTWRTKFHKGNLRLISDTITIYITPKF